MLCYFVDYIVFCIMCYFGNEVNWWVVLKSMFLWILFELCILVLKYNLLIELVCFIFLLLGIIVYCVK